MQVLQKKEKDEAYHVKTERDFLKERYSSFFQTRRRSVYVDNDGKIPDEKKYIDLKDIKDFHLNDLISFQVINARRSVDNKDLDKTLSKQTSELYKSKEADAEQQSAIEVFKDTLYETDKIFTEQYSRIFADEIEAVEKLGGMTPKETQIKITSALQHKDLLNGNSSVVYNVDDEELPENFNGLGYMNLISMIFDVKNIKLKMQRNGKALKPADINIIFIEEPEAHTHPQMQYVFIKNIKELLGANIINKNGKRGSLQCMISTHSSHIVSNCDFNDIKYLRLKEKNSVEAKSMKDFSMRNDKEKEFLIHYLTLNRCELFFAEKAVFIEGDTERILLPVMMKKLDQEVPLEQDERYLLSQDISVIEVGNYSHIFVPFFDFIGLRKALVITDLDICKKTKGEKKEIIEACVYDKNNQNLVTTNNSLKFYFEKELISDYVAIKDEGMKTFSLKDGNKKQDKAGNLQVRYQQEDNNYQARSFEDGFFHINKSFIVDEGNIFLGLKQIYIKGYKNDTATQYELAEKGIKSKATLATDILFNSKKDGDKDYSNWEIPAYIKEGLLWLRKNK